LHVIKQSSGINQKQKSNRNFIEMVHIHILVPYREQRWYRDVWRRHHIRCYPFLWHVESAASASAALDSWPKVLN